MNPLLLFVIASLVVIAALLISLIYWLHIAARSNGPARQAGVAYVICFALYAVGQTLALLQAMNMVGGSWAIPSYMYAVAALIFAVGSHFQYKALVKK